jgi:hypothetical protein
MALARHIFVYPVFLLGCRYLSDGHVDSEIAYFTMMVVVVGVSETPEKIHGVSATPEKIHGSSLWPAIRHRSPGWEMRSECEPVRGKE